MDWFKLSKKYDMPKKNFLNCKLIKLDFDQFNYFNDNFKNYQKYLDTYPRAPSHRITTSLFLDNYYRKITSLIAFHAWPQA